MFVVWILKPAYWWCCQSFISLWKPMCDIYVHIKMVQLSPELPKKKCACSHSIDIHILLLCLFIFLYITTVYFTIEVYYFLKLTSHWLSYYDYCIKMTYIRFSFLILKMNSSDVQAAFKDMEFLERDHLVWIFKWGKYMEF